MPLSCERVRECSCRRGSRCSTRLSGWSSPCASASVATASASGTPASSRVAISPISSASASPLALPRAGARARRARCGRRPRPASARSAAAGVPQAAPAAAALDRRSACRAGAAAAVDGRKGELGHGWVGRVSLARRRLSRAAVLVLRSACPSIRCSAQRPVTPLNGGFFTNLSTFHGECPVAP